MRFIRTSSWLIWLLLLPAIVAAASGRSSISGSVRDPDGKPLSEATVTLTGRSVRQVTSDSSGHFIFAGLEAGSYSLSASFAGYAASAPASLSLRATAITADIVLVPAPTVSQPPLEFQSSGIRGLIDPGGYSASTQSAASGVLSGITHLKRTDTALLTIEAQDMPCALESQLREAAARQPEQFEANLRLGRFYVAHDEPAQAIPPLQRALALDGNSEPAPRLLAMAWLESGNFVAARDLLVHSLAIRNTPVLHRLLARASEGSGLFLQAAEQYRLASTQAPLERDFFDIGYELLLSGQVADAAAAFSEGIIRYPKSIPMRIGAGTSRIIQGDAATATDYLLEATEIDPLDPRPYSFLAASTAISSDQQERALSAFKRYLDLAPGSASANYFYASALSYTPSPDGAQRIETLLKRAIELDPALAKAHLQLADSYARRGDFAAAIPEYEATLRLTDDREPHYRLALAYKRVGRSADSAHEMQVFRQTSETGSPFSNSSGGIDLAQLVSTIDDSGPHSGSQSKSSVRCPSVPQ